MDVMKKFIGKKVFILLKSGRRYEGIINTTTGDSIVLNDKFNDLVFINVSEISSMNEEEQR